MKSILLVRCLVLHLLVLFSSPRLARSLASDFNNRCRNFAKSTCKSGVDQTGDMQRKSIYFGLMLSFPDITYTSQREYSNYDDGHDIAPAAYLAAKHVNNRSDILKDYEVKLVRFDGGCDIESRTAVGFNELVCSCESIVGVIGPTCEKSSAMVSQLTNNNKAFSMISINYGGSNESVEGHDYSFGIVGVNSMYADVVDRLIRNNSWTNPALLYTGSIYSIDVNELKSLSQSDDAYNFTYSSAIQENSIPLNELKDAFVRIIIIFAPPETIRRVICMAYREDMIFPYYQWIFSDVSDRDLRDSVSFQSNGKSYKCTDKEIRQSLNGSIGVFFDAYTERKDDSAALSKYNVGLTSEEYRNAYQKETENYSERFNVTSDSTTWALPTYEAVWVLALALNKTLIDLNYSLTEYKTGSKVLAERLRERMLETDIIGVSEHISFNKLGYNTKASLSVFQFGGQSNGTIVNKKRIAVFEDRNLKFINDTAQLFIKGNFSEIYPNINPGVAGGLLTITSLSLLLVISAQFVNIYHRNHKVVKASSPTLNHLIFLGCYLVIFGITFQVLITFIEVGTTIRHWFCNFVPGLLNVGVTLFMGTVCIKTWRLNRLYMKSRRLKRESIKCLSNSVLAGFVSILVIVDLLICIMWNTIDPLKPLVTKSSPLTQDSDIVVLVKEECHSSEKLIYYWLVVLLLPKVLLTLASFLLALSTNMSRKEFKTNNVIILTYLLAIIFGTSLPVYIVFHFSKIAFSVFVIMMATCLNISVCICIIVLFLPLIRDAIKRSFDFCNR